MHVKDVNKGVRTFFLSTASRFNQANVSNEAIVISYYALLAIIPLMIFIGNLLPLLHLKASTVLAYIEMAIPRSIYQTLKPSIIQYLENGSSGGAASISGLISIWAASRGFNAMKRSLNVAYGVENSQGMLARRLFAFLFTAFLGVAFVLLFIIYSFGQAVLEYLAPLFNLPMDMIDTFNQVKWPTIMVGIFWIMVLLYAFIPNAKLHLRFIWPGALFATCGWMVLTQGFSVYVKYFARTVLSYGTIGTVIVVLFWLNFTCWVIMVGGIINATLEEMCFGEVKPKYDPIENFGKNAYNRFLKCKK